MSAGGWVHVHKGLEGDDTRIGGLAVWRHPWTRIGSTGPMPGSGRVLPIYEAGGPPWPVPVRFAAAEVSNGVWSFWEPGR